MTIWKAKTIAELIDLAVLLIMVSIGSVIISVSTTSIEMLLGLLVIIILIPYQMLSNRVWRRIKKRLLAKE
jgi:hypothetical protein